MCEPRGPDSCRVQLALAKARAQRPLLLPVARGEDADLLEALQAHVYLLVYCIFQITLKFVLCSHHLILIRVVVVLLGSHRGAHEPVRLDPTAVRQLFFFVAVEVDDLGLSIGLLER